MSKQITMDLSHVKEFLFYLKDTGEPFRVFKLYGEV